MFHCNVKVVLAASLVAFSTLAMGQSSAEIQQKLAQLTPEQKSQLIAATSGNASVASDSPGPNAGSPLPDIPTVTRAAQEPVRSKESTALSENSANESVAGRLVPFGYDLFAGTPSTFAPATDIPIPQDYTVGPGDVIEVQLFGSQNAKYSLTVQRDGAVQFPQLGPVQLAGLKFDDARTVLTNQISKQMIGVSSAITLGALRSIRVFILGDARSPGSYTVSSLSTITNALLLSGGIAQTGSLRNIELKRQGRLVSRLDLYDLLLKGDTSRDLRLQPGDVLFVPPVGQTVGVSGEVRRPATYELSGETSASQLIAMAGGLLSTAEPKHARVDRIDSRKNKSVIDLDLNLAGRSTRLNDGDVLRVPSILDRVEGTVFLQGHVSRPGGFRWRNGMRLTDILPNAQEMLARPDLDAGLIAREDPIERTVTVLPFSPRAAFSSASGNPELLARDTVFVFGLSEARSKELDPILDILRVQARKTGAENIVSVQGQVHTPGQFPLHRNMHVSDLIKLSLNLTDEADENFALLVREDTDDHEISIKTIDLRAIKAQAGSEADALLHPKDTLLIFAARQSRQELLEPFLNRLQSQSKLNSPTQIVRISGDVRFPGTYPYAQQMEVADLIGIAGGLAEPAYALEALVSRSIADQTEGYSVLPINVDLAKELAGASSFILQADDTLQIKRLPNFKPVATVVLGGEFLFPGEYRIQQGETLSQLIQRVGGLTKYAYPSASLLSREQLKEAERQQMAIQKRQLEKDLARLQLLTDSKENPTAAEGSAVTQNVIDRLSSTEAVGRLVIDLHAILKGDADADVTLEDGDRLVVGRRPEAVAVYGEVLYPTSHHFQSRGDADGYIKRSGGATQTADKSRIYIIRANGEITANATGGFFGLSKPIEPGDTVVVPYDLTRIDKIKLTSNIVQILSNLAVTAASLSAVGVF